MKKRNLIIMGAVACFVFCSPTVNTTDDTATSFAGVFFKVNDTNKHLLGLSANVEQSETETVGEGFEEVNQDKLGADNYVMNIVTIPNYSGFKSYESYKAINNTSSSQYKIQSACSTNEYGLRIYNGFYVIAVGTGVGADIGQYINLVLENGTKIPCVVGDIKDNSHTDSTNLITVHSNCASEFIVDISALESYVQAQGDISYAQPEWDSPVCYIEVLSNNVLYEIGD